MLGEMSRSHWLQTKSAVGWIQQRRLGSILRKLLKQWGRKQKSLQGRSCEFPTLLLRKFFHVSTTLPFEKLVPLVWEEGAMACKAAM